jgi:transposase
MEPDFKAQKCYVAAEVVERHRHLVTFLPKYHPELNPIEYVWGCSKIYARQNCSYSLPALRKMIPKCLGPAAVTDEIVWRFFQRVERILEAYRSGETYGTEAFKNRVYKSHRRVAEAADAMFDI